MYFNGVEKASSASTNDVVVNVLNNKVVAVGAGVCALKLKFTVDGNELVDTKTVTVKTPVFCGDV